MRNSTDKIGSTGGILLTSEIIKLMNKNELHERIIIAPHLHEEQIGRDSIDIRLSGDLYIASKIKASYLNPLEPEKFSKKSEKIRKHIKLDYGESFTIHPKDFIIADSFEYICLPKNIIANLQGRSSWGRLGLIVHATAGIVHPSFQGILTFELSNLGPIPIKLYPLMRIAQLVFYYGTGECNDELKKSQFHSSITAKNPDPNYDFDYEILKEIRKHRKKNLKNSKFS